MLSGELIKRQVEEELEKERQREIAKHNKMLKVRENLKQANDVLIQYVEEDQKKEAIEYSKIELYA